MKVTALVQVLGKVQKPWKDSEGNERISYSANIMQDNGTIIDTIRLSKEQFECVEANKPYTLEADFGTGKNGGYNNEIEGITQSAFFYNGQTYPSIMVDNVRDVGSYIQVDLAIASEYYCKYRERRIYNNMAQSNSGRP